MSRPHSLTEGNILTSLMGFALPVLAALFLQTMYGAVDMMIVGPGLRGVGRVHGKLDHADHNHGHRRTGYGNHHSFGQEDWGGAA